MQSKNSSLSMTAVVFIFVVIYLVLVLAMGVIFLIVKINIFQFYNSSLKNKKPTISLQVPTPIPRTSIYFTLDGIPNDWTASDVQIVPGKINKAVSFSGDSSSYLKISNSSLNKIKNEFSLSFWVNRLSQENSTLAWISDSNKSGFGILVDNQGKIYCRTVDGISGRTIDSSTGDKQAYLLTDSGWHDVSAVMDKYHCSIYIDGAVRTSVYRTHDNIGVTDFNLLTLGGQMFKGYIDDVRIYDFARSPEEIKQDMMIAK